ncbi:hypothetical protein [Clostridium sp. JS66]|uniref:hypothetical protein n=1 Tax=Clostridium sp. JS66 TaxID=3064705 RepID=UPI00298D99D4|nr:hypothetical protein [Clostridium sp. JS66]WPC41472.1 hypothetical protein Q6H37_27000 [Clostridium sp. JS66]
MIYNKEMESYLNISSKLNESSSSINLYILRGVNCDGEPYFYLKNNCCNLIDNDNVKFTEEMLTKLEWDCNEIYINDSEDIICLLQTALFTVKLIKTILKTQYSSQSFDIVMSLDDGKEFEVLPSATIRFYAIRNNYYYISHDKLNLESFSQPILIESVKVK